MGIAYEWNINDDFSATKPNNSSGIELINFSHGPLAHHPADPIQMTMTIRFRVPYRDFTVASNHRKTIGKWWFNGI